MYDNEGFPYAHNNYVMYIITTLAGHQVAIVTSSAGVNIHCRPATMTTTSLFNYSTTSIEFKFKQP